MPANVAANANWDCHIYNLADFASLNSENAGTGATGTSLLPGTYDYTNSSTAGYATNPATSNYQPTGLQILTGPAGAQFLPSASGTSIAQTNCASMFPSQYITGKCRLVGGGFEIVNTTANLYKQGVLTAYRMPQICENSLV